MNAAAIREMDQTDNGLFAEPKPSTSRYTTESSMDDSFTEVRHKRRKLHQASSQATKKVSQQTPNARTYTVFIKDLPKTINQQSLVQAVKQSGVQTTVIDKYSHNQARIISPDPQIMENIKK